MHIVVIEDDIAFQELVRRYIRDAGLPTSSVQCATTVAEAAKLLAEASPATVVLADLNLPDSSGEQTITFLSGYARRFPTVVMTSIEDRDHSTALLQAGVQDYIPKDLLSAKHLGRYIRHAVERHALFLKFIADQPGNAEENLLSHMVEHDNRGILLVDDYTGVVSYSNTSASMLSNTDKKKIIAAARNYLFSGAVEQRVSIGSDSNTHRIVEIISTAFDAGNRRLMMITFQDVTDAEFQRMVLLDEARELQAIADQQRKTIGELDQRFFSLVHSVNDAIMILNASGRVEYLNPSAEELFGYSFTEVAGIEASRLLGSATKEWLGSQHEERTVSSSVRHRNGTFVEVEMSASQLQTEDMEWHTTLIIRDVTERKQAEQRVYNALRKERELSSLRYRLVTTVSHEFRTPLTAIQSSADLLKRIFANPSPVAIRSFSSIDKSVERLVTILDDVITIQRLDADELVVRPRSVDIPRWISAFIAIESHSLSRDNLLFSVAESARRRYMIDIDVVRVILSALINNASKFSGPETSITLSVYEEHRKLRFTVTDKGQGIPQDEEAHLFEPFFRGRASEYVPGLGLGLAISQRAAHLLSGSVSYQPALPRGCIFTLSIPAVHVDKDQGV